MNKKIGLAGMLGLAGCIFVHSHETQTLLLRGRSEGFDNGRNHVGVTYHGPCLVDGLGDDYIVVRSYGPGAFYHEEPLFVSSGDKACVLGIELEFEIINDNDRNIYNNMLKIRGGRCR